jgi:hypothetical protein
MFVLEVGAPSQADVQRVARRLDETLSGYGGKRWCEPSPASFTKNEVYMRWQVRA